MNLAKMSDGVSVIVHFNPELAHQFERTLTSIFNQSCLPLEVLVICRPDQIIPEFDITSINTKIIPEKDNLSQTLNAAREAAQGQYFLYIDNTVAGVVLKFSFIDTIQLVIEKYADLGMFYGDYDLNTNGERREIRLLKHHAGRLRDNQDYGKVFLFSKAALAAVGGFDESLKFKTLYDIRLKLSEKFRLVHIANKTNGALYQVNAEGERHNVFDYLLAGKEIQLEAENVLTSHLKRIGAYLRPDQDYSQRPDITEKYDYLASVIIPAYRRPEFIATALDSVFKQTLKNIEVIVVVNGGSLDPTVNEVRRYMPGGDRFDANLPPVRLVVADINN
ncbi:MAG: glycosyltransferase, partial [Candidatus Marinimicrobia bacterium]|nr:glycosyltransferase [Candidatus Neomarinimicrobiota bacterium]